VPLILDEVVEDDDFCVRLDALQRAADPSSLGDFHYVPVVIHEAERASKEHKALLELLGLILGTVQGREPAYAILMHGRGCETRRPKLHSGGRLARRTLEQLKELRGSGTLARLTLNSHCQVCEFRQRCRAEAEAKDDLSLLRGMGEKEIAKYARRGIFTVTQLSCTFRPPRRMKKPQDRKVVHSHALQALAVRDKKVYVLGTPDLPTSAKRIYLDVEGDPERGFCYLAGMVVGDGEAEERHSFWIDSPADEPALLARLLDVAARHPDAWLYAYGSYEAAFLRRVGDASGRKEEVAGVLARLCNVLSVVHTHVYFPVYSNGLKDIAGHLGFAWTERDASGVQSIVWRRRWEEGGQPALKEKLLTYNLEDCDALKKVTHFLYAAWNSERLPAEATAASGDACPVARVEEIRPLSSRPDWKGQRFALPDFEFVNERAYFDYQRDRVYVRTNTLLKKSLARKGTKRWKKGRRVNREVEISGQTCPSCGGAVLTRRQNRSLARLAFDLRITRGGVRRWVTRYRTSWHECVGCGRKFLPADYLRLEEFCHSLKSWAMYEYVAHRTSLPNIADTLRECFGLPIVHSQVHAFKHLLARYYEVTYQGLLQKIVTGTLAHVDETEVHVRGTGKAYVWVFANLEEVVFLYRPSREGDFLHDLLRGFRGVLVTDFYAAYDSVGCPQQKCLVHLVRDLNQDIQGNPWDEELKALASAFGGLLRAVVATIDQHGLRRRHLSKHRRDVDDFYRTASGTTCRSETAEGLRQRLLKYKDKLFTFLEHDGIPWNNNNAEHAVKAFAHYREGVDHLVTEGRLEDYLVLLSIQQTCKYKGVSFLKFLLSRETDIDVYRRSRGRAAVPMIELYPEGSEAIRLSRKRLEVRDSVEGGDAQGANNA
jgi:predicted RecB family nuclease